MVRDGQAADPAPERQARPGGAQAPAFGDLRGGPMNHWKVEERAR